MYWANISESDTCYIFRNVSYRKKMADYHLRPADVSMTYSTLRDLLRHRIRLIGEDPLLYGLHRMRAGGCTAASNAGISD